MGGRRRYWVLGILLILSLMAFPAFSQRGSTPGILLPSLADLVEELKPVVVNISTTKVVRSPLEDFFKDFRRFFGDEFERFFPPIPEFRTRSLGSGFIIDREGYILTNNHVIEGAEDIKVKLHNGKVFDARVVGRDPKSDIALLKIDPKGERLPVARLGDSDRIRVGDWVIAIGNPFGLEHTVTVGVISAKGRVIGMGPYDDFLQTDASINPGNSGGPLFNLRGEVVGINTAIVAGGQGIGFAIPINMAKGLLPQLKRGKVVHGFLGVYIQDLTPELAKRFGLKKPKGALVTEVIPDSPAEKAGLRKGDVIVGFNGKEVQDSFALRRLVGSTPPGKKVKLEVVRRGKTLTLWVTVGESEVERQAMLSEQWGFRVQEITPEIAGHIGIKEGVLIAEVRAGSPAAKAGLRAGDVVVEIEYEPVRNLRDFERLMEKYGGRESLLMAVKIQRENYRTVFVVLQR
ncbi:MAG: peptidase [Deltaproteobacteria bacterium]|nr:MAG: peptidase [Deltaproteobacteria bacterium]